MDITSPFVVVPVIVATFFVCILWATHGNVQSHHREKLEGKNVY
jgi:hypothetical protein